MDCDLQKLQTEIQTEIRAMMTRSYYHDQSIPKSCPGCLQHRYNVGLKAGFIIGLFTGMIMGGGAAIGALILSL